MNNEYLEYAFYLYMKDNRRNNYEPIYKLEDMLDNHIFKKYIDSAIKKIREEKIRNILHND